MKIFLLEYDRRRGHLASRRIFESGARREAENARLQLELNLNQRGVDHEVVLLEAADEEALQRTHRRYFENLNQMFARVENSTATFVVRETNDE